MAREAAGFDRSLTFPLLAELAVLQSFAKHQLAGLAESVVQYSSTSHAMRCDNHPQNTYLQALFLRKACIPYRPGKGKWGHTL